MHRFDTSSLNHNFSVILIDWILDNQLTLIKMFRKKYPQGKNIFNLELPPINGAKKDVAFRYIGSPSAYYKGSYTNVLSWKTLRRLGAPVLNSAK